ncbi:hypothetical protein LR48_Vigan10g033000 [Vigna angularis]|uniref:Hydrophobic seed protein domain-containing protein n=2 Tax=Phaseolus angularis TaxID=3914 RepID=A0A0L9VHJ6_PHAAN|nr:hypothetical protein LR48_Vigan10g033000 [Vigna angularis]BAU02719.1 hypothetical protein VIGAN_11228600 [Vigna angularis var. angularis]
MKMGETSKSTVFLLLLVLLSSSMVSSDIIPALVQNNRLILIIENLIRGDFLKQFGCGLLKNTPSNATICSALDRVADDMHSTPQTIFNTTLGICGLNPTLPFPCN